MIMVKKVLAIGAVLYVLTVIQILARRRTVSPGCPVCNRTLKSGFPVAGMVREGEVRPADRELSVR
jgi:hypothetical protein